jgi:hypothetical protein
MKVTEFPQKHFPKLPNFAPAQFRNRGGNLLGPLGKPIAFLEHYIKTLLKMPRKSKIKNTF